MFNDCSKTKVLFLLSEPRWSCLPWWLKCCKEPVQKRTLPMVFFPYLLLRVLDILSREATLSILSPCCKGVHSKRKQFAAFERKFFPFRRLPFQKWIGVQESKQEVTKVVSLVQNDKKFTKVCPAPLTLKRPRKSASENVVCLSSAEYSCKLFKPIFAYRQIVWTLIRLLLGEQSDLDPHCLQNWFLKSQADDKADDCCDWLFKIKMARDTVRQ